MAFYADEKIMMKIPYIDGVVDEGIEVDVSDSGPEEGTSGSHQKHGEERNEMLYIQDEFVIHEEDVTTDHAELLDHLFSISSYGFELSVLATNVGVAIFAIFIGYSTYRIVEHPNERALTLCYLLVAYGIFEIVSVLYVCIFTQLWKLIPFRRHLVQSPNCFYFFYYVLIFIPWLISFYGSYHAIRALIDNILLTRSLSDKDGKVDNIALHMSPFYTEEPLIYVGIAVFLIYNITSNFIRCGTSAVRRYHVQFLSKEFNRMFYCT